MKNTRSPLKEEQHFFVPGSEIKPSRIFGQHEESNRSIGMIHTSSEEQAKAVSYQLINAARAVEGIETNYKATYENEKKIQKAKEQDAKLHIEEMNRLLKV